MKLFSNQNSIPRSKLIKYATLVCIFTIIWNIIEGVVSIFFGNENDSISLIFFGVDSFIEVTSACLVLWRFLTESKPDEEKAVQVLEENLGKERKATIGIGLLFLVLSTATISDAIVALVQKRKPETAVAGLIISSVSLSFMGFLWLSKKYLAKMLNSFTMASDAQCSLACIKITLVLFIGSFLYIIWKDGWWLDSTAAIILGVLFAKEGVDMILWARSKNFSGGCCKHDAIEKKECCENETDYKSSVNSASNDDEKRKKCGITITVEQFTSLTDRLSFRKSKSSTIKIISTNQEDVQENQHYFCSNNEACKSSCCANEFDKIESTEKCCGDNKESTEKCEENKGTNQSSCCSKEIKGSIDKSNVKVSTDDEAKVKSLEINTLTVVETQDTIDVVKTEEKESSCACCHDKS